MVLHNLKKGLLITNTFLNTDKFTELTHMFAEAADHIGCAFDVKTGADVWAEIAEHGYEKKYDYDLSNVDRIAVDTDISLRTGRISSSSGIRM